MSVNIYDDLNQLETTFRKSAEFTAVEEAVEVVKADADALQLFKDFRKVQLELQEKQMQGEEITEEELADAQATALDAQANEKIMTMLEAEMKLSGLIEEVNRVLMKPVQTIYESMN